MVSHMRSFFLFLALPLHAQFITPEWRGSEQSEHAQWDSFTKAKFEPNAPDIVTDDATITCTTSSAFLTSSGNIYSFQAPTFFQLDDTTEFPIKNLFLQISALGSGIDLSRARAIFEDPGGNTISLNLTRHFILSEEELGGERGGIGTTYALQWDLSETPISGSYSILFNATESSLSLDKVSLDTVATFVPVEKTKPLVIQQNNGSITLTWLGDRELQSSHSLSENWTQVSGSAGVNTITLPISNRPTFFRLKQTSASE